MRAMRMRPDKVRSLALEARMLDVLYRRDAFDTQHVESFCDCAIHELEYLAFQGNNRAAVRELVHRARQEMVGRANGSSRDDAINAIRRNYEDYERTSLKEDVVALIATALTTMCDPDAQHLGMELLEVLYGPARLRAVTTS